MSGGSTSHSPASDALPCLEELQRRGFIIGLAGNQPARTERFLHDLGVEVDLVGSSASWGVEKPSAEFFTRLTEELDLSAAEIAYVGDRVDNDVVPVKKAGMVAVHVRRGPWGYLQTTTEADFVVTSLLDIADALSTPRKEGQGAPTEC